MTAFGDYEPEDAWDAGDETPQLIRVLYRMVAALDGGPTFRVRNMDELDEILQRVARFTSGRHSQMSGREGIRVFHIIEGIAFLRGRNG